MRADRYSNDVDSETERKPPLPKNNRTKIAKSKKPEKNTDFLKDSKPNPKKS